MSTPQKSDSSAPVVELSNVHSVYHLGESVPVFDGVSITIRRGTYTAIMGPSGSGKSTLLNLIVSLTHTGKVVRPGTD